MTLFAAVTLAGAFLLFLVEPLLARAILPWFGGVSSVWATCLVFYQIVLLGGYLYAHLGRRLGVRRQAVLHAALLVLSLALLPIAVSPRWKPTAAESPTWWLLALLTATVGGPYFLLASTAPLLHDWFGELRADRSPYPLYAVSNAGSVLALAAYPAVVEPLLGVRAQARVWSVAYAVFVVACAALSLIVARGRAAAVARPGRAPERAAGPRPPAKDVAFWVALSACGAGLLLAITDHMTLDIAPVPLLWVVPLGLYLVSFIVAFAGLYRRGLWGALLVLALGAMAILWNWGLAFPTLVQLGVSAGVLFAACMVCHGELVRSAPSPDRLTTFYLAVATGGAVGGALVALVAPLVLPDYWELPALLLSAYLLLLVALARDARRVWGRAARLTARAALATVFVLATAGFVVPAVQLARGTVATARNFYGVLRVQDHPPGPLSAERVLMDGRIIHGGQFLDRARRDQPTTYFTPGSGVALAIQDNPRRLAGLPLRIGVIGLGVGTLAALGEPGDSIRFYEINPAVVRMARRYFTFLRDSPAEVDVVLGDGRLSLEREMAVPAHRHRYDVLVVDAFSSDAIPIQFLTVQAADLYWTAIEPDGVIVFQATNRHVDLAPVVRGLAAHLGCSALEITSHPRPGSGGALSSWILVTRNRALIARVRSAATPAPPHARVITWTDNHSDLLQVLR